MFRKNVLLFFAPASECILYFHILIKKHSDQLIKWKYSFRKQFLFSTVDIGMYKIYSPLRSQFHYKSFNSLSLIWNALIKDKICNLFYLMKSHMNQISNTISEDIFKQLYSFPSNPTLIKGKQNLTETIRREENARIK